MLDSLLTYSSHPAWIILIIIVSTFMLEDLAIIGAALLAASGKVAPEVAFAATCLGMFIGDSALYLFGRAAHFSPWLAKRFQHDMIQRQVTPLQKAPWHQLALIRCMPGLRTFGYIACGLAKVPGWTFTIANVVSIWVWAAAIFSVAYVFGKQYADTMAEWLWWLLPVALIVFVLGQRKLRQNMEDEDLHNSGQAS